jgi:hypothetical protein
MRVRFAIVSTDNTPVVIPPGLPSLTFGALAAALDQLPQAAAQAIPAVVPVGAPMDER